jgi:LuxR family maltose regulon positive regulatory protein
MKISVSSLTPSEQAVVAALLEGRSYAHIALGRSVSVHTIRKQASSAYRKLGVSSRSELVARDAVSAQRP